MRSLISATMESKARIPINSDADIVLARAQGRMLANELGFPSTDATVVATAISEVARNIVQYASHGEIVLWLDQKEGKKGLVIVAKDEGPGIDDIGVVMQPGYSTANSLGLGLPGAKRLMDEFEIASLPGKGTTVTMKKWGR